MVIKPTSINKRNNHLSPLLNPLSTKKTTAYEVRNPGPGLGQAQKAFFSRTNINNTDNNHYISIIMIRTKQNKTKQNKIPLF